MSFGIAGICICISIGLVTTPHRVQHPLAARQGKKPLTGSGTCTGQRRFITQSKSRRKANPGSPSGALASWAAMERLLVCSWNMEEAAHSCTAQLIGTLQHFFCPDKTIKTSAVEQVFGFFSRDREKHGSTGLLEWFTGWVGSECCAVSSWVAVGASTGYSNSSAEQPGVTSQSPAHPPKCCHSPGRRFPPCLPGIAVCASMGRRKNMMGNWKIKIIP